MSYRRQKRWWNAYILFYERTDALESYGSFERPRGKGNVILLKHVYTLRLIRPVYGLDEC